MSEVESGPSEKVRDAYLLFRALTDDERGQVMCWFFPSCFRYLGPGDACRREDSATEADRSAVRLEAKRQAIVELQQRVLSYTREGEPLLLALEYAAEDMFKTPTGEGG